MNAFNQLGRAAVNPYHVKVAMSTGEKAELAGDLSLGLIPGVSPFYFGAKSLGKLFHGNWKGSGSDALWALASIIPGVGAGKGVIQGVGAGAKALKAGKGIAAAGRAVGGAAKGIKGIEAARTAGRLAAGAGALNMARQDGRDMAAPSPAPAPLDISAGNGAWRPQKGQALWAPVAGRMAGLGNHYSQPVQGRPMFATPQMLQDPRFTGQSKMAFRRPLRHLTDVH